MGIQVANAVGADDCRVPQAICHLDFSTRFVSPSTTTKDGSPNFFHHGMDRSLRSGRDIGRSRLRVLPLKHCGLDAL